MSAKKDLAPAPPPSLEAVRDNAGQQSLGAINAELHKHGLRPLLSLGSEEPSAWKIVRFMGFTAYNAFYTIGQFLVRRPDGTFVDFNLKLSHNGAHKRGCVAIVTYRNSVFLTMEFRVAMLFRLQNPWCKELPRGFPNRGQTESIVETKIRGQLDALGVDANRDLAASIIGQKLAPLFALPGIRIMSMTVLERTAEDTGMSGEDFDTVHIKVDFDDPRVLESLRGTKTIRIRRFTWQEIVTQKTTGADGVTRPLKLEGAHTLVALWHFFRHMGWLAIPKEET